MKNFQPRMVIFLACMLLFGVSCNDDDSDGGNPISPLSTTNVSGAWTFTGQLTRNECELNAYSSINGDIYITQSGSRVSTPRVDLLVEYGESWFFYYAGTTTGSRVSMAATDPYVSRSDGAVIHFGSGIEMQNINDHSANGSLNVTGKCIQGCTGSCQTIWTGPWTR